MWSFLARLKERKLAHWGIAYLAGAWLLLQVLDHLAHTFSWPEFVLRAATVLTGVGFLAALVVAWYHLHHFRFFQAAASGDHARADAEARAMMQAAPGSEEAVREAALSASRARRPREALLLLSRVDFSRGL